MRIALAVAFCLFAASALADVKDDALSALLKQALTEHGKSIVHRESELLSAGDLSLSGLKGDLRQDCPHVHDCLRLHGLTDDSARTEMSRLIMGEAADHVHAKIISIKQDVQREIDNNARGKDKDFDAKKSMEAELELHRMRNIEDEVHDALRKVRNDDRKIMEILKGQ